MKSDQTGSLLIEVLLAMTILAVGLLGFFSSFMSNSRLTAEVGLQDAVRVSLENATELLRSAPFDTLYADYEGAVLEVPELPGPGGVSATAEVHFYVNETAIPSQFGLLTDIDGNPATQSANCSTAYRVLPTQITLRYLSTQSLATKDLYILLRGQ